MKRKILVTSDPIQVENRVNELFGLRRDDLMEVVSCMVAARNGCTDNDAPSASGLRAWLDGTRRLREVIVPKYEGWDRDNEKQVPSVCCGKRGIKIVVCNGDPATGHEDHLPQNRNRKGAATESAVSATQLTMDGLLDGFEEFNNIIAMNPTAGGPQSWYLFVYSQADDFRAELSCPAKCENGYFTEYYERIILVGPDGSDGGVHPRKATSDDDLDLEITVTRKQA